MSFHRSHFPHYEVRKIHEKMENQLEMGKIRHSLTSLFYFFFFLTRIQSLVGGQAMNLVLLHGAECQNWNYFAFLFGLHRNLTLQAIQINNYRERTITGGFIYLGFSGSFSIALNASKHSLYNSRIYLGQQRTEEKYKHNIYWTGRVFFLLSLKEFFLP